jgi:polyphosphate kinase 2 (PPK2 family)
MSKPPSLSKLLDRDKFPALDKEGSAGELEKLQLRMLRIQQGTWHLKRRAIILFEGFDSSGKGGAIQRLVQSLDPRGFQVHPIGPPHASEQGRHYLYRFWQKLPVPGTLAIFDRSWYGRVLVEKVEKLAPPERIHDAYREIREFERQLVDDGVALIKIFVGIDQREQLRRFRERLADPYKQWKITPEDMRARAHWKHYVKAADKLFAETHDKLAPWHLVAGNDKDYARVRILEIVTDALRANGRWMEGKAAKARLVDLKSALKALK